MKLSELAVKVATDQETTKKTAEAVIKQAFEEIAQAMADGKTVNIPGFGRLDAPVKKERMGRNPRTGEPMKIPAKRAPRFRPTQGIKDRVNAAD